MDWRSYFDDAANDWDSRLNKEVLARIAAIVRLLDLTCTTRVLDVGTGTGVLLPLLESTLDPSGKVVALDLSLGMLRRAQAKQTTAHLMQADVCHLPLSPASFDCVICNAVFPHFGDKRLGLGEICRILEPGGTLLIAHAWSRKVINRRHKAIGHTLGTDLLPNAGQMRVLLAEAGLTNIVIRDESDRYVALAHKRG